MERRRWKTQKIKKKKTRIERERGRSEEKLGKVRDNGNKWIPMINRRHFPLWTPKEREKKRSLEKERRKRRLKILEENKGQNSGGEGENSIEGKFYTFSEAAHWKMEGNAEYRNK